MPAPDFERVFDEMPVPLLLLTPDLVIVRANRARAEATGRTLEDTVGRHLFDAFPADPADEAADGVVNLGQSLTQVLATRRPHTMAVQRYDLRRPEGTYEERYWSPRNVPVLDDRGGVAFLLHRADDITEYVRAREAAKASKELSDRLRERADRVEQDLFARTRELEELVAHLGRATRRAELLARVTSELTATLDAEEAVGRLARLVVPQLADWCIVSLVTEQRRGSVRALRDVGSWHAEDAARPLVAEYAATRLSVLRPGSLLDAALSTGRAQVRAAGATEHLLSVLEPGRARDLVAELAPESLLTLPLRARGRTLGALVLANGAARSPITAEETATATDIAGRAGLALDNARLHRQQRELAETLQRSLLTAPASPDHLEVAVRYTPAAEAARIGGDWYDSFVQPGGATTFTIGDVLGHDTEAAASMAQVRTLLRGVAVATGAGPAAVLAGVDRAMVDLQVGTTATAVVARLEQTVDEAGRGARRLVWSNAGHPPPVLVTPSGQVSLLHARTADLLLGVLPDAPRGDSVVDLEAGSTLVFCTDGLVERRGEGLDEGLTRLTAVLEDCVRRDLTLEALCDELLERVLPERPEDDVALLAVRLHRQDGPADARPPGAADT
ncbi:SpoIIE family protein phosphatase [Kineococcus sp. DHX-1]|uniref:SpoIIE family protein phosphatase n=1 Tax=Kineococcus sp. DHX-1 TaxID=3349638 RepID=UPI0036D37F08